MWHGYGLGAAGGRRPQRLDDLPWSQAGARAGAAVAARGDDAADRRLSLDVYFDVWTLAIQYKFSLDTALAELVRRVRRQGREWGCSTPIGPVLTG